ncbi:MAG: protein translocase subunit SecD [Candidatus Harrisonbacteria bacterium]|nr:protein translocase subunit SecD [Candidatus Harrisonbacteria bacterium]
MIAYISYHMKNKPIGFLVGLLVITVFGLYFIIPGLFDKQFSFRPWRLGLDLIGGAHLVYEVDTSSVASEDRTSVLNGLRDVIERRVNLFGVAEPQVYLTKDANKDRLTVELAGITDVEKAIQQIGETPLLTFSEVKLDEKGEVNDFAPTALSGRYIKGANLAFDQVTRRPLISLKFDNEGATLFEQITAKNVGKPIAVFLDGSLIQMPTVQEKISGGQAQITGNFTIAEARQIVERFNAGALPAPVKLVSQETIGASLGLSSLRQILWAGLIGTLLVVLFMIFYYQFFGVVTSIALLVYIVLNLLVLKLFGVTMSLSGIAGFILSIGMAVDANILIFERAKEESKRGLSKLNALDEGFRRAWFSIRDSNITTIITSLVLYYFTTGFVKGFALTLLIGVLISMFSAINVTRNILRVTIEK